MPQFVYDDIVKKIIKRERYKIEVTKFSTLFSILKESSQYEYKDGIKRFVRLVNFKGNIPYTTNTRMYQEGFAIVYPRCVNLIKMNLQCISKLKKTINTYNNAVLQKPPYTYLKDNVINTADPNTSVSYWGDSTKLQASPDVFYETFNEIYPFIDVEYIMSSFPALIPPGMTSSDFINNPMEPISGSVLFNEKILEPMVNSDPPLIDADELAVNHENAVHEVDQGNTLDCTSYEFTPRLFRQYDTYLTSVYRPSKTATSKSSSGRNLMNVNYESDPTYDSQLLTEIPLRASKIGIHFYAHTLKFKQGDTSAQFYTNLSDGTLTKWSDNIQPPRREYRFEKLDVENYNIYDTDYGKLDTSLASYISGNVNETAIDPSTLKQDIVQLKFFVCLEVLLVDMKKK